MLYARRRTSDKQIGKNVIKFEDPSPRARNYYLPGATSATSWLQLCKLLLPSLEMVTKREREALLLEIHRGLYDIKGVVDISLARGVICIICMSHLNWEKIHPLVIAHLTKHFGHALHPVEE